MEYVDQTTYAGITRIRFKGMISAFVSSRFDKILTGKGTPKRWCKGNVDFLENARVVPDLWFWKKR